jgi:uncharacterized membrane protein
MEIVNSKEIKKFVWIISILTIIFINVPIIIYFINFNGSLSDDHTKWGSFGDYIGGIVGTLFNLIAVLFSIISIYITLKIATRIHENEQRFNQENIVRETERFQKEIELTHKQNKPFPHLHLTRFVEETKIMLCNYGTGPMIIKELTITYDEKIYTDFADLLVKNVPSPNNTNSIDCVVNNDEEHIISSDSEKILFLLKSTQVDIEDFKNFQNACREIFTNITLHIKFEDIFENIDERNYSFAIFS